MKKVDISYVDIKKFIEANYIKDKDKIKEMGIEDYNDYFVDNVLGTKVFENEVEEFLYSLSICIIMKKINVRDQYYFEVINDLKESYKESKYDKFLYKMDDKIEIDKDLETIK